MKLDRLCSPKALTVALAALLPVGAAYATDLQDSLKTLLAPAAQTTQAAPPTTYRGSMPADSRDMDVQGAQGPIRSDTITEEQPTTPQATEQQQYETAPAPSEPVTTERSP